MMTLQCNLVAIVVCFSDPRPIALPIRLKWISMGWNRRTKNSISVVVRIHWNLLSVVLEFGPVCKQLGHRYCLFKSPGVLLPAATKLGQGNKFTGVCLSTEGGGGTWPGPGGSPNFFFHFFFNFFPPPKNSFGDAPPPPPRDGQCAAGTHPTGMHSC